MTEPRRDLSATAPGGDATFPVRRFAHDAMGTTFEILIVGEAGDYARQAARTAFEELVRLEEELSAFLPSSDVSKINRLRPGEAARVGIAAFECLRLAARIHAETARAFDVTVASARGCTGTDLLMIDEAKHTVGVKVEGVRIDLGGVGKGYAVDRMAALLRDWSIETALVQGGESTVLGVGSPPGPDGWLVAIRDPEREGEALARVRLRDRALSGSAALLRGKHIIDPRAGRPAEGAVGAWAQAPSAAVSDALSTAFFIMSPDEVRAYCDRRADVSGMLLSGGAGERLIMRFGEWET